MKSFMDNSGNIYSIIGYVKNEVCYDNNNNVIDCPEPLNIDSNNNIIGGLIGVYDIDSGKCFDFEGNEIDCPKEENRPKELINFAKVEAKRTYWWILIAAIVAAWVIFFIYRYKNKNK